MFLKDLANEEIKENFIRLAAVLFVSCNTDKTTGQDTISALSKPIYEPIYKVFGNHTDEKEQKNIILSSYVAEAGLNEFDLQGAIDDAIVVAKMERSELVKEIYSLVSGADLKFYAEFKMLSMILERNDILNLAEESIKTELKASDEIISLCDSWVKSALFFINRAKQELKIK
ncbi:hypothetical protein [uncultured Campylobacter sp.]|uniref:hypothetical protein n=1 Tax=uncultured Campylobacter sp. TaxID=218934 RepID=UPI00262717E4|nr:hypothetical protein [uncultured Campylobacter sp.]